MLALLLCEFDRNWSQYLKMDQRCSSTKVNSS
jgi:hypothetical protein